MSCKCCIGLKLDVGHLLFLILFGCIVFALAKKGGQLKKDQIEKVKKAQVVQA
jgi:hypothetical protein